MYRNEQLFPYAEDYCMVFPRGLENKKTGKGSIVIEEDYIIYFKEETPEEIKQRFIKDYAEWYSEKKATGLYY